MNAVGIDVSKSYLDVSLHGESKPRRFCNNAQGITALRTWLLSLPQPRVLLEATGGYENAVLASVSAASIWVCRINPRQVRDFAKALGQLAKTDVIDSQVLALMVHTLHTRMRPYQTLEPWRAQLIPWVHRRVQLVRAIQQQRQQMQMLHNHALRTLMNKTIEALEREMAAVDREIAKQCQPHALPHECKLKGVGPVLQAILLALLPELGTLSRHAIAKLVGIAPLNCDSGEKTGKRHIWGGRASVRTALYMATLSAIRWEQSLRDHYQQLKARGKPSKVALVACMRKMLVILNARQRDHMNLHPLAS